MFTKSTKTLIVALTGSIVFTLPVLASPNEPIPSGQEFLLDAYKEGTRVELDEDQDEVYEAVQQGLIKPFSELYETIDKQLNGRLIRVELEEDNDEWIYDLKLMHEQNVIKVEYNATTLEMIELKGRNLHDVIKK